MEGTSDTSIQQMKRQREEDSTINLIEEGNSGESSGKRQKSSSYYSDILSVLEEEEEDENEPEQDLSSLITTLQHEISPASSSSSSSNGCSQVTDAGVAINSAATEEGGEISETEKVMRRLLEASDDELGLVSIPDYNSTHETEQQQQQLAAGFDFDHDFNGGDDLFVMPFCCGDGLWEIEDEAANYYTLLQSELFM